MSVILTLCAKRHNRPFRRKRKNVCSGQIYTTSKSLLCNFNTKAMQQMRSMFIDYILRTCQACFTVAQKKFKSGGNIFFPVNFCGLLLSTINSVTATY